MTPTQRTQKWLRDNGYMVANAERKMPCTPKGYKGLLVTQDLFGFIDTLAVNHIHLLAVQSTDGSHHAHRLDKIMHSEEAKALAYYMDIQVWSWSKGLPEGKPRNKATGLLIRRKVWKRRVDALTVKLLPKDSLLRRKLEEGTWDVALPQHRKDDGK
jgi:hypothetical protein